MRDPLARFPIKYKLPLTFLFLCLIMLSFGGILVSNFARNSLESEIGRRLEAVAVARAGAISASRELLGRRVQDFASDGLIRETLGRITESKKPHHVEKLASHLRINKTPLVACFLDCSVWDNEGHLVAGSREQRVPAMAETAMRAAGETGLWYSAFQPRNDVDPSPVFAISTPVYDLTGSKQLGRLSAWVHVGRFLASVHGIGDHLLNDESSTKLILEDQDGKGFVVPRWLMNQGTSNQEPVDTAIGIVVKERTLADSTKKPASSRLFSRTQTFDDGGWRSRVELDAHAAMAPIRSLQSRFLGVGMIIMMLALATVLVTVGFIVLPLNKLRSAAEQIGCGDLKVRVHVDSDDEIGVVASSFNAMAEAVESRTHDLERKRDELALVVQSMRDGLCLMGADNEVILSNAAAEPIRDLFRTRSEATARLTCAAVDKNCADCLLGCHNGDQTCELEIEGRTFEVTATTLPTETGLVGRLLVSRDITERLKIAERQSFQERMSVVGEVSSAVAHEINNPLASISMYNQMMADELEVDSPFHEHVEVIGRNTKACKRAIRDLLDNVRGGDSEIVELDLIDVADDVQRFLSPLAKSLGVTISCDLEEQELLLLADEYQLRQVLVNLVMNGVQAAGGEGSHVRLHLNRSGDSVICDVSDDGPGVPPELRKRIFDPFFTTKAPGEGTGLGLPTSRRIIEELGGQLELRSEQDGSTIFRVTMPAFHPNRPSQAGSESRANKESEFQS